MMIKGCFLISLLPSRAVRPAAAGILRWCTLGLEQWIGVAGALAGLHAWILKVARSSQGNLNCYWGLGPLKSLLKPLKTPWPAPGRPLGGSCERPLAACKGLGGKRPLVPLLICRNKNQENGSATSPRVPREAP